VITLLTALLACSSPSLASAEVGAPAPTFTLPDLDGKPVSLASHLGKTVVLEWFNPGCPFVVKQSHAVGSPRRDSRSKSRPARQRRLARDQQRRRRASRAAASR
jgi:hypothetical protein